MNPLPSRGITWNIKSCFVWKTMKQYLWMSSAAVVIGALRVKSWPKLKRESKMKTTDLLPLKVCQFALIILWSEELRKKTNLMHHKTLTILNIMQYKLNEINRNWKSKHFPLSFGVDLAPLIISGIHLSLWRKCYKNLQPHLDIFRNSSMLYTNLLNNSHTL